MYVHKCVDAHTIDTVIDACPINEYIHNKSTYVKYVLTTNCIYRIQQSVVHKNYDAYYCTLNYKQTTHRTT